MSAARTTRSTPSCGPMTPSRRRGYRRPRRSSGRASPRCSMFRIRTRAHDGDVGAALAAASEGDSPVGLVGRDDVVRGPERAPLEQPQRPVRAARGRPGNGTRRARGRGRDGRRRSGCRQRRGKDRPIGQKMSGGLQAWTTSNRPRPPRTAGSARPSRRTSRRTRRRNRACCRLGAYGRYLYSETPSTTSYAGSPGALRAHDRDLVTRRRRAPGTRARRADRTAPAGSGR